MGDRISQRSTSLDDKFLSKENNIGSEEEVNLDNVFGGYLGENQASDESEEAVNDAVATRKPSAIPSDKNGRPVLGSDDTLCAQELEDTGSAPSTARTPRAGAQPPVQLAELGIQTTASLEELYNGVKTVEDDDITPVPSLIQSGKTAGLVDTAIGTDADHMHRRTETQTQTSPVTITESKSVADQESGTAVGADGRPPRKSVDMSSDTSDLLQQALATVRQAIGSQTELSSTAFMKEQEANQAATQVSQVTTVVSTATVVVTTAASTVTSVAQATTSTVDGGSLPEDVTGNQPGVSQGMFMPGIEYTGPITPEIAQLAWEIRNRQQGTTSEVSSNYTEASANVLYSIRQAKAILDALAGRPVSTVDGSLPPHLQTPRPASAIDGAVYHPYPQAARPASAVDGAMYYPQAGRPGSAMDGSLNQPHPQPGRPASVMDFSIYPHMGQQYVDPRFYQPGMGVPGERRPYASMTNMSANIRALQPGQAAYYPGEQPWGMQRRPSTGALSVPAHMTWDGSQHPTWSPSGYIDRPATTIIRRPHSSAGSKKSKSAKSMVSSCTQTGSSMDDLAGEEGEEEEEEVAREIEIQTDAPSFLARGRDDRQWDVISNGSRRTTDLMSSMESLEVRHRTPHGQWAYEIANGSPALGTPVRSRPDSHGADSLRGEFPEAFSATGLDGQTSSPKAHKKRGPLREQGLTDDDIIHTMRERPANSLERWSSQISVSDEEMVFRDGEEAEDSLQVTADTQTDRTQHRDTHTSTSLATDPLTHSRSLLGSTRSVDSVGSSTGLNRTIETQTYPNTRVIETQTGDKSSSPTASDTSPTPVVQQDMSMHRPTFVDTGVSSSPPRGYSPLGTSSFKSVSSELLAERRDSNPEAADTTNLIIGPDNGFVPIGMEDADRISSPEDFDMQGDIELSIDDLSPLSSDDDDRTVQRQKRKSPVKRHRQAEKDAAPQNQYVDQSLAALKEERDKFMESLNKAKQDRESAVARRKVLKDRTSSLTGDSSNVSSVSSFAEESGSGSDSGRRVRKPKPHRVSNSETTISPPNAGPEKPIPVGGISGSVELYSEVADADQGPESTLTATTADQAPGQQQSQTDAKDTDQLSPEKPSASLDELQKTIEDINKALSDGSRSSFSSSPRASSPLISPISNAGLPQESKASPLHIAVREAGSDGDHSEISSEGIQEQILQERVIEQQVADKERPETSDTLEKESIELSSEENKQEIDVYSIDRVKRKANRSFELYESSEEDDSSDKQKDQTGKGETAKDATKEVQPVEGSDTKTDIDSKIGKTIESVDNIADKDSSISSLMTDVDQVSDDQKKVKIPSSDRYEVLKPVMEDDIVAQHASDRSPETTKKILGDSLSGDEERKLRGESKTQPQERDGMLVIELEQRRPDDGSSDMKVTDGDTTNKVTTSDLPSRNEDEQVKPTTTDVSDTAVKSSVTDSNEQLAQSRQSTSPTSLPYTSPSSTTPASQSAPSTTDSVPSTTISGPHHSQTTSTSYTSPTDSHTVTTAVGEETKRPQVFDLDRIRQLTERPPSRTAGTQYEDLPQDYTERTSTPTVTTSRPAGRMTTSATQYDDDYFSVNTGVGTGMEDIRQDRTSRDGSVGTGGWVGQEDTVPPIKLRETPGDLNIIIEKYETIKKLVGDEDVKRISGGFGSGQPTEAPVSTGMQPTMDTQMMSPRSERSYGTDDFTQTDMDVSQSVTSERREIAISTDFQDKEYDDELERLRRERQRILDMLAKDIMPSKHQVELAEAQLNYLIGQTDTLLDTLNNPVDWDINVLHKFAAPEENLSAISKEYLSRYRDTLELSRQQIETRISELEDKRVGQRESNKKFAKMRHDASIEAFKLERTREQTTFNRGASVRSKSGSPHDTSRHSSPNSSFSKDSEVPNAPLFARFLTPTRRKQHLTTMRKDLVRTTQKDEKSRSLSPAPSSHGSGENRSHSAGQRLAQYKMYEGELGTEIGHHLLTASRLAQRPHYHSTYVDQTDNISLASSLDEDTAQLLSEYQQTRGRTQQEIQKARDALGKKKRREATMTESAARQQGEIFSSTR